MEPSDATDVARARAGDPEAFRALVDRHARAVHRVAWRLTGNAHDAEDVVQETFLRAFRRLDQWESRSSLSSWLYRIAANCAYDLLRSRQRAAQPTDDEEGSTLANLPDPDPAPDRLVYGHEVRTKVERVLARLTPLERTAFVMRHYEGLSIEEISQALGSGPNTTKSSIFRAVQKVRRALRPLVQGAAS